jgi:hypothetical protein
MINEYIKNKFNKEITNENKNFFRILLADLKQNAYRKWLNSDRSDKKFNHEKFKEMEKLYKEYMNTYFKGVKC